jgi:hypothetical protein
MTQRLILAFVGGFSAFAFAVLAITLISAGMNAPFR